jgi:hypothetical protein
MFSLSIAVNRAFDGFKDVSDERYWHSLVLCFGVRGCGGMPVFSYDLTGFLGIESGHPEVDIAWAPAAPVAAGFGEFGFGSGRD